MKADHDRVRELLTETVTLLCKNGLCFSEVIRIEGLIGITVDSSEVFIVHIDETVAAPMKACVSSDIDVSENLTRNPQVVGEYVNDPIAPKSDGKRCQRQSASLVSLPAGDATCHTSTVAASIPHDGDDDDVIILKSDSPMTLSRNWFPAGLHCTTNATDSSCPPAKVPKRSHHNMHMSHQPHHNVIDSKSKTLLHNQCHSNRDRHQISPSVSNSDLDWPWVDCDNDADLEQSIQMNNYGDAGQDLEKKSTLPLNIVANRAVRESLAEDLIKPFVCNKSKYVTAFRIIWQHHIDAESLHNAWMDVIHRRDVCDQIIRSHPGVDFFISAICGLFNKSRSKQDAIAQGIVPAISCYIVGTDIDDIQFALWPRLQNELGNVNMKLIMTRQHGNNGDVASAAAPLYIVLKDYNSSFVRQRVALGHDTSVASCTNSQLCSPPAIGNLVIVNSAIIAVEDPPPPLTQQLMPTITLSTWPQ